MGNTANFAFPFPGALDATNVPGDIQAGLVAVDAWLKANVVVRSQGTLAARPVASALTVGMLYFATDNGNFYYCNATPAWVPMPDLTPFLTSAIAATTYMPKAGGTFTGSVAFGFNQLQDVLFRNRRDLIQTIAASGAARNLDPTAAVEFDVTLDQDCTFTFGGADGDTIILLLRQPVAVKNVVWPATVDWPGATVPTQQASTAVLYRFHRIAGRWTGFAQTITTKAQLVVKNADESVTSSITIQDDDELLVPLAVNTDYAFTVWLRVVIGTAGGDGSIKCAFTVPAGANLQWSAIWQGSGSPSDADAVLASGTALGMTLPSTSGIGWVRIDGTVKNGANAGNLTLQWAQNVSSSSATVVKAGSSISTIRE